MERDELYAIVQAPRSRNAQRRAFAFGAAAVAAALEIGNS